MYLIVLNCNVTMKHKKNGRRGLTNSMCIFGAYKNIFFTDTLYDYIRVNSPHL